MAIAVPWGNFASLWFSMVQFLLKAAPAGGYYTPSMLMGALRRAITGSSPIRVG